MSVCSLQWVGFLLFVSTFFFLVPTLRLRQLILCLCNLLFLFFLVPDVPAWIALAVFLATGYAAVKILIRYPRQSYLTAYLILFVAAFLVIKQYAFIKVLLPETLFHQVIIVVGFSYMLFRQIHLAVDATQEQLEHFTLWSYVNYQINVFGIVAGPIQRFQDFLESWSHLQPILTTVNALLRVYLRIFLGVIKVALIAPMCLTEFDKWSLRMIKPETFGEDPHYVAMAKLLVLFYLYPFYIYFNFAGYCDIVIGGAALLGMKMPENFNRPYLSRNMIDYWTRWHRTLGFWIRDYLFTPLYKATVSRWPARAATWAFLCYFVALFVTGVWHGSSWNFVIFGLLNGIGVAAAKLWETYLVKRLGRPGLKRYLESRPIRYAAMVATFHFVCLTIVFFPADLSRTMLVIRRGAALII